MSGEQLCARCGLHPPLLGESYCNECLQLSEDREQDLLDSMSDEERYGAREDEQDHQTGLVPADE
jgi:hypothetical protein